MGLGPVNADPSLQPYIQGPWQSLQLSADLLGPYTCHMDVFCSSPVSRTASTFHLPTFPNAVSGRLTLTPGRPIVIHATPKSEVPANLPCGRFIGGEP
jgi:hypothetical protein